MIPIRTIEEIISWLKIAEQRQRNWQQEVKKRWAEKQCC